MKFATTLKTLTLAGLTAMTLAAPASQADTGYVYFGSNANPWANGPMNPWMANPAMHQARFQAEMKQRHIELDQRQDEQMERILGGMDKGRLTSVEAAGLIREHLAIATLERKYVADGRLGPNELADLEKRVADAGRRIMFESRDREVAATIEKGQPPRQHDGRPGDFGRPGDSGRPGDYGYGDFGRR